MEKFQFKYTVGVRHFTFSTDLTIHYLQPDKEKLKELGQSKMILTMPIVNPFIKAADAAALQKERMNVLTSRQSSSRLTNASTNPFYAQLKHLYR